MTTSRKWLTAALVTVLVGAFTVSASSTWKLGDHFKLADVALPALVLMLEVGSVTGVAIYVATRVTSLRIKAGALVVIAAVVSTTGGVRSYGWLIGLAVTAVLLLMVEVIAEFWHLSTGAVHTVDEPQPVTEPVTEPIDWGDQTAVDLMPPVTGDASEVVRSEPIESNRTNESWREVWPTRRDYAALILDVAPDITQRALATALSVPSHLGNCPQSSAHKIKQRLTGGPTLEVAS